MAPPARTYLMVPHFDFPTDSSIQLGNLLVNPFTPHRPVASLASDKLPELTESVQKKRSIIRAEGDDARFSLWLQALQILGGKTGVESGKKTTQFYDMDALKTSFFKTDPRNEDIRELLSAPKVQSAMRSTFWSHPVFLISGLKVAEGLSSSSETIAHRNATAGISAAVAPQASLGMDAGITNERDEKDSFHSGQDIVLAYQLLKISRKGQALAMREYHPKAGFLGEEDNGPELSAEIEITTATVADLSEVDEDVVLKNVIDDQDCISVFVASIEE